MRNKTVSALLCLALLLTVMSGCGHEHEFAPATCTEAETCGCGEIRGEPLGHQWVEASCTEPKRCAVCGEREGDPLGHEMAEATYDSAAACIRCGLTGGEPLSHDDDAARLVGEWEGAMPAGILIGEKFTSDFPETVAVAEGVDFCPADYFRFDAVLPLELSFRADGSCALSCREEARQAFRDEMWQELEDSMLELLESTFDLMAQSSGLTVRELYAKAGVEDLEGLMALGGYTADDLMEDSVSREEFEGCFDGVDEGMNGECSAYRTEGGMLFFDGAAEDTVLAEPLPYDYDGETLTLKTRGIELAFTRK